MDGHWGARQPAGRQSPGAVRTSRRDAPGTAGGYLAATVGGRSGTGRAAASGRTLAAFAVAISRCWSGTSCQPGSSSNGSDATTTDAAAGGAGESAGTAAPVACLAGSPFSWLYQSVSPQAVAAIDCPSVSRKLNRPVPPAADTAAIVPASASPMASPARSRSSTSAHRNAESTIASSDSSAAAPPGAPAAAPGGCGNEPAGGGPLSRPAAPRPPASGTAAAGQPFSSPLWLNSQGPAPKGAAAASPSAVPSVAERTAARTAPERVTRARSGSVRSPQIGTARRYLAGTGSPPAYQPIPKPSAFTVPCRCSRGAHACR